MIKLENIKINGNVVECDIYPEDSKTGGHIAVDTLNGKIVKCVMPTGYEWCKNHLEHAREYITERLNETNDLNVSEKNIDVVLIKNETYSRI